MADIVQCNKLTKIYDGVCALNKVDLRIPDNGRIVAFCIRYELKTLKRRLNLK